MHKVTKIAQAPRAMGRSYRGAQRLNQYHICNAMSYEDVQPGRWLIGYHTQASVFFTAIDYGSCRPVGTRVGGEARNP